MTNRIRTALTATLLFAIASPSMAGPCDAYYSFDGTLTDGTSNGYDGIMFGKGHSPATPQFVDGKYGQALMLDGTSAMRAMLDLRVEACPQVTFSAWILADAEADSMHVLSSGQGSGPGLRVSGPTLTLAGTDNGIMEQNAIRKGGDWIFVAGVYDYTNGYFTLHLGGDPNEQPLADYRYPAENAIWVGTVNDGWNTFANGVSIDDLRFTGRLLSTEQITALRNASTAPGGQPPATPQETTPLATGLPACDVQADCATGTYCAFDNSCHPDSHMPKRALELTVLEGDPGVDASNVILGEGARSETELSVSDLGEDYFYGDWCFHPDSALPYGMDQIRSFNFAATKTGPASYRLAYEFRDSPGVTGGTGSWAWGVNVTDRLIVVWAFENSGETIQDLKVTRATQQRFFADVEQDSGRATFVRGQCNTSENFAPESIQANYFVGPWCITESTIPNEPSKPNWRFLFHNTGSMSRNPGDGRDYSWNWRQEAERLELSDNGITTSRSIRSVSAESFQWGTSESRTYVRGACPTLTTTSGPDLTAGPQGDGQGDSLDELTNSHIRPGPAGEPVATAVSGIEQPIRKSIAIPNGFMSKIIWWEKVDRPCKVNVYGWGPSDSPGGFAEGSDGETMGDDCNTLTMNARIHNVALKNENETAIGRMQVCLNSPFALQRRIKGIRIWGDKINDDGSTSAISSGDSETLANCSQWSTSISCAGNQKATGLVVHASEGSSDHENITGLQLICRGIKAPGDLR